MPRTRYCFIEAARSALTDANIRFEESELVSALLENKAGELGEVDLI
jgi:hypothetical protein